MHYCCSRFIDDSLLSILLKPIDIDTYQFAWSFRPFEIRAVKTIESSFTELNGESIEESPTESALENDMQINDLQDKSPSLAITAYFWVVTIITMVSLVSFGYIMWSVVKMQRIQIWLLELESH